MNHTIYILHQDGDILGVYYNLETALDNILAPYEEQRPEITKLFQANVLFTYWWQNKALTKSFVCDSDINNPILGEIGALNGRIRL